MLGGTDETTPPPLPPLERADCTTSKLPASAVQHAAGTHTSKDSDSEYTSSGKSTGGRCNGYSGSKPSRAPELRRDSDSLVGAHDSGRIGSSGSAADGRSQNGSMAIESPRQTLDFGGLGGSKRSLLSPAAEEERRQVVPDVALLVRCWYRYERGDATRGECAAGKGSEALD